MKLSVRQPPPAPVFPKREEGRTDLFFSTSTGSTRKNELTDKVEDDQMPRAQDSNVNESCAELNCFDFVSADSVPVAD